LTSPTAQNVGVVKDLFAYLALDQYLTPQSADGISSVVIQALIIGVSQYTDPSAYIMHLGLILCSTKKSNPLSFVLTVSTIYALMVATGADFNEQVQNITNILTLRDNSENIGIYFYISIEVFKKHAIFFKYAYLLFCLVMLLQIRQLIRRGYAVVALCTQTDYEKYERRMFRLKCITLFLVAFIKVVFNQYPLLLDIQVIQFLLICCNLRFANKYIEGHLLIAYVIIFSALNTLFMWITWLDRFSGNANFFYFQTIVYNFILIVLFIQVFNGVNTKILK
jgi:hypothetical protein